MSGDKAACPVLWDLRDRLERGEAALRALVDDEDNRQHRGLRVDIPRIARLEAKASGVALARSYVDEYLRELQQDTDGLKL